MKERDFGKYLLLIVAVVAVIGLLTTGDGITGFVAKKASKTPRAPPSAVLSPRVRTCVDTDGGVVKEVKGTVSGEYVTGQRYSFTDVCRGAASLVEQRCTSPSAMGTIIISCPRGSQCSDGACRPLCGNGRVDNGENCGTCPADVRCGAGQKCSVNACVALCGNGRVDVDNGENCGTCPADVRCGADQECQNGQCLVRPFCRRESANDGIHEYVIVTQDGRQQERYCQDDITPIHRMCVGNVVVDEPPNPQNICFRGGCNISNGECCFGSFISARCEGNTFINTTFSTCLNRELEHSVVCDPSGNSGPRTECSADARGCIRCGLRFCIGNMDEGRVTHTVDVSAGENCWPGERAIDPQCS